MVYKRAVCISLRLISRENTIYYTSLAVKTNHSLSHTDEFFTLGDIKEI